jgi:hypothetical protein
MITTKIVTPTEVKTNAKLDDNVSDDVIDNTILLAQVEHAERPLGTELLQHLIDEEVAGTLTNDEANLLDFVTQAVSYATAERILTRLQYRVSSAGVSKLLDSEKHEPVSGQELQTLREFYRDAAAEWLRAGLDLIKENESSFPLYKKDATYDVESLQTSTGGLFFPKKNYNRWGDCDDSRGWSDC